jgi:transcriptional regulator with XRE-family HTH domain
MAAPKYQTPRKAIRTMSPNIRKLFEVMRERRIHQVDMAAEFNMSRPGFAYWKIGRTEPSISQAEAFAQIMGFRLVLEPIEEKSNA